MRLARLIVLSRNCPSAFLLLVQLLGLLLYPFLETTRSGPLALGSFGIAVLIVTVGMVRRTPWLTWISVGIALPATVLLAMVAATGRRELLPWSSAFECVFYFYAAGSLIAYMMQ